MKPANQNHTTADRLVAMLRNERSLQAIAATAVQALLHAPDAPARLVYLTHTLPAEAGLLHARMVQEADIGGGAAESVVRAVPRGVLPLQPLMCATDDAPAGLLPELSDYSGQCAVIPCTDSAPRHALVLVGAPKSVLGYDHGAPHWQLIADTWWALEQRSRGINV